MSFNAVTGEEQFVTPRSGLPVRAGYAPLDYFHATGATTSPAAAAVLASIATPGAGTYEVIAIVSFEGTAAAAAERDNVSIRPGAASANWINHPASTVNNAQFTLRIPRVTIGGADNIQAVAVAIGTVGTIYRVALIATLLAG